jgi:hypothetical protein
MAGQPALGTRHGQTLPRQPPRRGDRGPRWRLPSPPPPSPHLALPPARLAPPRGVLLAGRHTMVRTAWISALAWESGPRPLGGGSFCGCLGGGSCPNCGRINVSTPASLEAPQPIAAAELREGRTARGGGAGGWGLKYESAQRSAGVAPNGETAGPPGDVRTSPAATRALGQVAEMGVRLIPPRLGSGRLGTWGQGAAAPCCRRAACGGRSQVTLRIVERL